MLKKTDDQIVSDVRNLERINSRQSSYTIFYLLCSFLLIFMAIYFPRAGEALFIKKGVVGKTVVELFENIPAFSICRKVLSLHMSDQIELALQFQYVYGVSAFSGAMSGVLLLLAARHFVYLQYLGAVHDVCIKRKNNYLIRWFRAWLGGTAFFAFGAFVLLCGSIDYNYCIMLGRGDWILVDQITVAVINFSLFSTISFVIAETIIFFLFWALYCRGDVVIIPDEICRRLQS